MMSDIEDEFDEADPEGEHEGDEDGERNEEPKILNEDIAGQNLSLLCKSGDGLSHAFIRLELKQKNLVDIGILQGFVHLRFVDISQNKLTDLASLNNLTYLLSLKADFNKLEKITLEPFSYLQYASFSNNKLTDTSGLRHPLLEHLNLNNNEITDLNGLDGTCLTKLHTLEIRENKIQSIEDLYIPSLEKLYIGFNEISSLEGISRMKRLEMLFLRKNQIGDLKGFDESMSKLRYLNIRENHVEGLAEIQQLQCLPALKYVSFIDNPISTEEDFKNEILSRLQTLEKLNKDDVVEEEKLEAIEIMKQRQAEKERAAELENLGNMS